MNLFELLLVTLFIFIKRKLSIKQIKLTWRIIFLKYHFTSSKLMAWMSVRSFYIWWLIIKFHYLDITCWNRSLRHWIFFAFNLLLFPCAQLYVNGCNILSNLHPESNALNHHSESINFISSHNNPLIYPPVYIAINYFYITNKHFQPHSWNKIFPTCDVDRS